VLRDTLFLCYTVAMTMIGMKEAAQRMGVRRTSALRALRAAGVPITEISVRAFAVELSAFEAFMATRPPIEGPGRPKGAKNKPKEGGE
jgi:hypothetical protein